MIAAILRAQFLSMRTFRAGGSRRTAVFSLLVAVMWYGFWAAVAFSAYEFTSGQTGGGVLETWLPLGLMLVFVYWQMAPLATASFGASLDLRKLLVYPVPRGQLFFVEVLLRLSTCAEMLLVLGGGAAGLLRNPVFGGWAAAARVLPAVLLFIVLNLLLAAGVRSLLERLLAYKRLREALVVLIVISLALPRLLMTAGVRASSFERILAPMEAGYWPWSAAARAALGTAGAGAGLLVLALWIGLAYLFGRWQFARGLRFDAEAVRATTEREERSRATGWAERFYRLPSLVLRDPLAAIVEKELRALSRTPRFRTVFIMGFTFGLIVWLPMMMGAGRSRHGFRDHFLVIVSLYAFAMLGQVSYWNSFGFDRSAAQVYFWLPAPISRALAGKNLAAALFILLEVLLVTAACLALRLPIPPARIAEAYIVTPVAALYMLALGNLSSVHFPRGMNPDRSSQGGAASRFQGLLFVLYPLALLPIGLAYAARYAFDSNLAFYLVLAFAAMLGATVYWVALESAAAAARSRREAILAELAKGAGPVVTE